jgi:hypothetical protein
MTDAFECKSTKSIPWIDIKAENKKFVVSINGRNHHYQIPLPGFERTKQSNSWESANATAQIYCLEIVKFQSFASISRYRTHNHFDSKTQIDSQIFHISFRKEKEEIEQIAIFVT